MTTIDADRIACDIETIARFSETPPEIGYSRPTFTDVWRQARDYVIREAEAAGCAVRIDAAGNVHARPRSIAWETPVWLSGSHLDSVPTGGKYDGVAGVVAPLEVLRVHPNAPLELIVFAEEEGTTFHLGMLGSRAWAGTLSVAELGGLRNRDGRSPLEAGAMLGVNPARLNAERLRPGQYRGLIELHIEQGPAMWILDQPVAVVTAINGRHQYSVRMTGTPNHAGSTKMEHRHDALTAAAECVVGLEGLGRMFDAELDHSVVTVGRLNVYPNALNVVPGAVEFSIDFRSCSNALLEKGDVQIKRLVQEIAAQRGVGLTITRTEALPAVRMDDDVCNQLRAAAKRSGIADLAEAVSGALHDSAILAPLLPTAMLFVASKDGISHNPAEFSRIEDIALGARIMAECVTG